MLNAPAPYLAGQSWFDRYSRSEFAGRQRFFRRFRRRDSIDGRFDMVALHAWLVFERLRAAGLEDVPRALSDAIFVGFDEALLDLGAEDMGMGRKIKQMATPSTAGSELWRGDGRGELSAAILRNVYRGDRSESARHSVLARYALGARGRSPRPHPAGDLDFALCRNTRTDMNTFSHVFNLAGSQSRRPRDGHGARR